MGEKPQELNKRFIWESLFHHELGRKCKKRRDDGEVYRNRGKWIKIICLKDEISEWGRSKSSEVMTEQEWGSVKVGSSGYGLK